jgi:hypothetical protein
MNRTTWLQERRMRKFRDVLSCNSSACSATTSLISRAWRRNSCSSSLVAAHAVSPSAASCRFLELLRPAVIKTFRNPLATAQLRYGVLATQPHKQDADFLLCAIPLDASARSARLRLAQRDVAFAGTVKCAVLRSAVERASQAQCGRAPCLPR